MTENIFLSYRRADSRGYTNAIYTLLEFHFGSDQIFMDIDTLVPGSDFVKCLEDAVEGCDIFLAIIGLRWENIKDKEGNRRLENPEDFVRIEVAHALKRGIPVIPVLVDGAEMPSSENLPDNLKELARRHAFSIGDYMRTDVQRLIKVLEKTFESLEQERIKLEKAEQKRKTREQAAEEKKTAQEKERLALQKAQTERLEKDKAEAERLEKIKAETERLEKIKAETERLKEERVEAERLAKERAEAERLEKTKAETERLKKEKAEAERLERIKAETERLEKIKAETERLAKERADEDLEVPEILSKSKRINPGIVLGIIAAGAVLAAGWYFLRPNLLSPDATEFPATQELAVVEATLEPTPIPTAVPVAWRRLNSLQFIPRDLVTVIVEDPTDQAVLYAGTSSAGIYKTINGGESWSPLMQGLSSAEIDTLVIDPADPNTLYAGLIYEGVSKTTDGGNTWFAVNHGIQDKNRSQWGFEQDVSVVVISPLDTQHLYFTEGHKVYETRDGGGSWTENYSTSRYTICQIVIHPDNDDVLYMATVENHVNGKVWKSEDSGKSWDKLFEDVNNEGGHTDLWVDHVNGDLIYFIVNGQRVHNSQDGGLTWNSVASLESETGTTIGTSWVGSAAFVLKEDQLYQTADSGSSWTRVGWDRTSFLQFGDLEVSGQDNPVVYLGTSGVYLNRLDNQGWIDRNVGLGGVKVALYLDPSNNNSLYMTVSRAEHLEQGDLFASEDGGITWELRSGPGDWESRASFNVAGGEVLYQLRNGRLVSSVDKGKTWSEFGGIQGAYSLLVNPYQSDIFVVGQYSNAEDRLNGMVSHDHGVTWEEIIGEIDHIFKVAFVKNQPDLMYTLADSLARSEDGGVTWEICGEFDEIRHRNHPIMSHSEPMGIVESTDSNHLLVATWDGIISTFDGCRTWQFSNNGLYSLKTNSISADPNNPDTIYAGTDNGAYVSFDSGDLWQPINDGLLGGLVVYSIVVDSDSSVYAATPLGVFQLEAQ